MDSIIEYIATDNDDLVKVVVFNHSAAMGWRCGYVGVPKGHPLYGKKYEELDFEVNGGLTYSDYNGEYDKEADVNNKYWYLGFDCAHSGDVLDRETKNKYNIPYKNDEFGYAFYEFQRIWDKESVIREVNNLALQIRKRETMKGANNG